jgi:hypothetical protein
VALPSALTSPRRGAGAALRKSSGPPPCWASGVCENSNNQQDEGPTTSLAQISDSVCPSLVAALLLAGREHLVRLDLPHPSVTQVIAATGASRSRSYELRNAVVEMLPSLQRPVGRPSAPPPPSAETEDLAHALSLDLLRFVMDHPGCVFGGAERRRYDDAFRLFVLELRERHADLDLERFAAALLVPLGTLKDWLGAGASVGTKGAVDDDVPKDDGLGAEVGATPESAQIQTVISGWKTWNGSFGAYCDHLHNHLRIPFGRSIIANILFVHGERTPRRRAGRSPDELALRRSFELFFPGAQWVGDGSPIVVTVGEQRFGFNLELMVDTASGGFVGMAVRDAEDSEAVVLALRDGIETTGEPPLAVLLDNLPANHTTVVDDALGDATLRMRATPFRPQNKAHCEGAFGLFQQAVPDLVLDPSIPRECARQLLALIAQTWARTLNHSPRDDRSGHSRVELYGQKPTTEQLEQARSALKERCRKQELARITRSARLNPAKRALLDEAFERLALLDPEHHLRDAIARYPLESIVDGIAIFEAKRRANTLPDGVDARYLLGIVRNIADEREGLAIAEALLHARLDARDRLLAPLTLARDAARETSNDPHELLRRFVDLALAADARLDHLFWLIAAADVIRLDANGDAPLVHAAARRILATHRLSYRERLAALRFLVAKVAPLD